MTMVAPLAQRSNVVGRAITLDPDMRTLFGLAIASSNHALLVIT